MTSWFDTEFAEADDLIAQVLGTSVRIRRGAWTSELVTAEAHVTNHEVLDDETGRTIVQSRDFLIATTDYTVAGTVVAPQEGDVIEETINGTACQFHVLPIAGRDAFEPVEPARRQWLVRTKEIT